MREDIRNVAIIAHVDHGKTTLVDKILRQCGAFRANQQVEECVMDSNPLERERGITILSKNCSVRYKGVTINIIDTPGHADFGGEVERVLKMADGCLLLVDAAEGPLPQTRFVLRKALGHGLAPILVINKVDRHDARPKEVLNQVYDLLIELGASDEQLELPVLYASGREGVAMRTLEEERVNLAPLLDTILARIPPPRGDPDDSLQLLVSHIDYDDYVGRVAVGRVFSGTLRTGQEVLLVKNSGGEATAPVKQLFRFVAIGREKVESLAAGDIAALVGLEQVEIGDSVTDPLRPKPLPPVQIDPPTIAMLFIANDSPFRGQEGEYVQSRKLRDRLLRELRSNIALRMKDTESPDTFEVSGRGILHLGILVETMRREGYEFQVAKPRVIDKYEGGRRLEPIEVLIIDVRSEFAGKVIELVGARRGEMLKVETAGATQRIEFKIPSRGLIGLRERLLTATRGEAVLHHQFLEYGPFRGEVPKRVAGVLVSMAEGEATPYALFGLKDRGEFFIGVGERVYNGQVVGEHCKDEDIPVNVCRKKHLTNIRSAGADEKLIFPPPREFGVEQALEYIEEDELAEFTPKSIRMRKRFLDAKERKRKEMGTR